ncbi:outer membrane beta-barrel protein [Spirosoma spitsbergense]|uniref:outer membrane beta-barrel protein n=1 Tax=Spirosoma spitsbergense TaxID=431554 RepID=UPI0003691313|nr:outer membrane beta-barrel protein [Spirosoma spitsbergense]
MIKTQVSLLAVYLLGAGLATAQTTTNSSSTTTTSTAYGTTPTTTTDSSTASGMSNSNATMGTGKTNSMGTTTNSMASPSYGTTTTTTTTTSNNTPSTTGDVSTGKANDRAWGKDGKFGVYAGVNFSRFVNEPIPDGAFRAGYQVGIYGRSAGTIFGQLGVEYRTSTSNLVRNGTGQSTQPAGEIRGQIDQQFVAIPAFVGVRIGSALGLRLQAGAELSALIRHPNNKFGINNDDIRRTILGGLLGAGVNLGPLTLDAVYNYGLQNVFEGADTKRRLIAVNLGFRF